MATVHYEAVVLGLGGMGSASLARLALRGKRVLGIEAFARGHEFGASSGRSRIIRKAYFEDAAYVPLLVRAYELWRELERASDSRLLDLAGVLMVGLDSSAILAGAAASALLHGIPLERLDAAELARRYPTLRVRAGEAGLFEPEAGVVFPERAIAAQLAVAEAAGAEMLFERRVLGYRSEAGAVVVQLDDGREVLTARLAVCAGPWLPALATELGLPVRVQRNVQVWFEPRIPDYAAGRFPAFFLDRAGLPAPLYGFPDYGDGVKAALHGYGAQTSAAELERAILPADVEAVASALDDWMPGAAGAYAFGKACVYALTPDEHFIIDRHPADARIVIAGGFSGHGFKFAPVAGEIVADLVATGTTRHVIDFLRIGRFGATGARQGVR
jgi:sarcosine oxidase